MGCSRGQTLLDKEAMRRSWMPWRNAWVRINLGFERYLVGVPGLVGRDATHVGVRDSNVRVPPMHIGPYMVAAHVLLAPHEGGRSHQVQSRACVAQQTRKASHFVWLVVESSAV